MFERIEENKRLFWGTVVAIYTILVVTLVIINEGKGRNTQQIKNISDKVESIELQIPSKDKIENLSLILDSLRYELKVQKLQLSQEKQEVERLKRLIKRNNSKASTVVVETENVQTVIKNNDSVRIEYK